MKFATCRTNRSPGAGVGVAVGLERLCRNQSQLCNSSHPVTVNGTTLKPGDYKVQWEGNGPNVELSILQGKNVVAKVPAHVVELQTPSANDAAVTRHNDNGPNSLAGIRFQGKKFALELGEASDGMQAGSSK